MKKGKYQYHYSHRQKKKIIEYLMLIYIRKGSFSRLSSCHFCHVQHEFIHLIVFNVAYKATIYIPFGCPAGSHKRGSNVNPREVYPVLVLPRRCIVLPLSFEIAQDRLLEPVLLSRIKPSASISDLFKLALLRSLPLLPPSSPPYPPPSHYYRPLPLLNSTPPLISSSVFFFTKNNPPTIAN